jgi:hypothetical protein
MNRPMTIDQSRQQAANQGTYDRYYKLHEYPDCPVCGRRKYVDQVTQERWCECGWNDSQTREEYRNR